MSKKKIQYHSYVGLCDAFRPDRTQLFHQTSDLQLYERPYRGRYYIMAKNEKKALELLRKACPFGSIQIYYQDDDLPKKIKWDLQPNTVVKTLADQLFYEVDLETAKLKGKD